jgi:SAM-dependent methyltransferase
MGSYEKFAEHYDSIYKTIVSYEKETDNLEKVFGKFCRKRPKSVLDVGCGTGSHSLILSKRGYYVVGIDISERMIEEARNKAREQKVKVEFCVQDMRKIRLNKKFDCAICMFGGFGYNITYEDLDNVFSYLRKHLEDSGLFIFEFWSVGGLKPSPHQSWIKVQDKDLVLYRLSESNFDPQTNVLAIKFHFIETQQNKPAQTFEEAHRIRCFTLAEMRRYLEDNGFGLVSAYDWDVKKTGDFKPPAKETFRILTVARKT